MNKKTIPESPKKPLHKVLSLFIAGVQEDNKFKELLISIKKRKKKVERFLSYGKSDKCQSNQLIILRKWNSYTPVLPTKNKKASKGGGYFITINMPVSSDLSPQVQQQEDTINASLPNDTNMSAKNQPIGIVIDPGYNFIENFFRAGFKLDDIDHVFISHAHNDHTVELESLFSLLYQRNRTDKRKKDSKSKKIKLYMNLGSFKKYSGYFDLSDPKDDYYIDRIILLNEHQIYQINESVEVFTTKTKHHETITKDYALGFTFVFKGLAGNSNKDNDRIIKFTCDTGWDETIEGKNKEAEEENNIDRVDILVAHLGSIKEKELTYGEEGDAESNKAKFYDYHLGLLGLVASINYWRPELTLISEFGEELNEVRKQVAEKVSEYLKQMVFPADLNLRINLDNMDIMCFKCRKYYDKKKIQTYHKGTDLFYICSECIPDGQTNNISKHLGKTITVFEK